MSRARGPDRAIDVLRRLAAPRADDARPAFLDGLLLGAMVGAAIAGSSLWRSRRARRRVPGERQPPDDEGTHAGREVPPPGG